VIAGGGEIAEKAKQRAPCIIFIDEIDSVGSKRASSSLHPYANQTINQVSCNHRQFFNVL
jgi:ATP-dependent metalloprotease